MTAFFETASRQAELATELASWKGTPFQQSAGRWAKAGASCDCVSFVAAVLTNCGAMRPFRWPLYVVRGGGKAMRDLLLSTLDSIPELDRILPHIEGEDLPEASNVMPGDLLVCSSGKALHHLALYAGNKKVWHSIEGYGVSTVNINEPLLRNHLVATYRAYETLIP